MKKGDTCITTDPTDIRKKKKRNIINNFTPLSSTQKKGTNPLKITTYEILTQKHRKPEQPYN